MNMLVQTQKPYFTPAQYLELEEAAEFKNEYRDGEIVPMTGGTTNHNQIAGNFFRKLPLTLKGQNYYIYMSDVRLWIPSYRVYTYPDIMVIQGEPIYEETGTTTVTNPLLIGEVLSKSTRNYDSSEKFRYYRSLGTFREYILLDQYSYYVQQYAKKADGQWLLKEYEGFNAILTLDSMDLDISLEDIYQRVKLEVNN